MQTLTRSSWTHSLCDLCYYGLALKGNPTRMGLPRKEICCSCGELTTSGIYYREDPKKMNCLGDHSIEALKASPRRTR